jgi:hypothetical protein
MYYFQIDVISIQIKHYSIGTDVSIKRHFDFQRQANKGSDSISFEVVYN